MVAENKHYKRFTVTVKFNLYTRRRRDTQHNDIQHNHTQHNNTQHYVFMTLSIDDTEHNNSLPLC